MKGLRPEAATVLVLGFTFLLGAAPVAPSHQPVESTLARIEADLKADPAVTADRASGWQAYLSAIRDGLNRYRGAEDAAERHRALERLNQLSRGLQPSQWPQAVAVRQALENWAGPRSNLVNAMRGVTAAIDALPKTEDPAQVANRKRWIELVNDELGPALGRYDRAATAPEQVEAASRLRKAALDLDGVARKESWPPTDRLNFMLAQLLDRPNVEATADARTLSPVFERDVVTTGPLYRRGQVIQVTAGPKIGFGLLPSDNGIAFYNRQLMSNYTAVRGFQEQLASDERGQKAAKLYTFSVATQDQSQVTVSTVIRTKGIQIDMDNTHNIQVLMSSRPTPGGGMGRALACLMGMNQEAIRQQVYQNAEGRIKQNLIDGSRAEAADRSAKAKAEQDARLAQFIAGNTLAYSVFAVTGLDLRSRPDYAWVRGTAQWREPTRALGADTPKPAHFSTWQPGVTADLHLNSLLRNFANGYLNSPAAADASSVLISFRGAQPGQSFLDSLKIQKNPDHAAHIKAVDEGVESQDPKALAVRVFRPEGAPDFAADQNGNLVVLVPGLKVDIPVPANARNRALGALPPAKIYRLESPLAEVVLSFRFEPQDGNGPDRIVGQIQSLDLGATARILALDDEDEAKTTPLNAFAGAFVLGLARSRVQGLPVTLPLSILPLPPLTVRSLSPLDPSGWIRLVVEPGRANAPAARVAHGG